jgi:hypothetical protein
MLTNKFSDVNFEASREAKMQNCGHLCQAKPGNCRGTTALTGIN